MFFGDNDSILGVSCGHGRIALSLIKGGKLKKSLWRDVDESILERSEIKSKRLFAEFLKDLMKENGISCRNVAFGIPDTDVFTRTVTMPAMSDDQIRLNIPFEFRDFIYGELKEFIFDYAYLPEFNTEEPAGRKEITLFAAAMPRTQLHDLEEMFKTVGLRLVKAMPKICAFEAILRLLPSEEEVRKERCIIDIGQGHTRLMIYKNGRYKLVHMIEMGERNIIRAVADEMNVDMHIARTYVETNYDNCNELPAAINVYKDISLEILKGLNFYEVSDMSARLADVTLYGGGSQVRPLVDLLKQRISMNVVTMSEMPPAWNSDGDLNITAGSLGLALG